MTNVYAQTAVYAHRAWSPIGAIELKSKYHANMGKAVVAVIVLFGAVIGGVALAKMLMEPVPTDGIQSVDYVYEIADLGPPPSLTEEPPQISITQEIQKPIFTIPVPVPDNEVSVEYKLPSHEELATYNPGKIDLNGDLSGIAIRIQPDTEIMEPTIVFVPFDEKPISVKMVTPKYPQMARTTQLEGTVTLNIHIDTKGTVDQALVSSCTTPNVGFEEAAIQSALQGKWRPAMQNKQPVAVWVSYPVVFRLK